MQEMRGMAVETPEPRIRNSVGSEALIVAMRLRAVRRVGKTDGMKAGGIGAGIEYIM